MNAIQRLPRCKIVAHLTLTPNPLANLLIMASNNPSGKPYDFGMKERDKIAPKKVTKAVTIVNVGIGAPPMLRFKAAQARRTQRRIQIFDALPRITLPIANLPIVPLAIMQQITLAIEKPKTNRSSQRQIDSTRRAPTTFLGILDLERKRVCITVIYDMHIPTMKSFSKIVSQTAFQKWIMPTTQHLFFSIIIFTTNRNGNSVDVGR